MARSPFHASSNVFAYCADCRKPYACGLEDKWIGALFECPVDKEHIASIVKGEKGKLWLRIRRALYLYEIRWCPRQQLRKLLPQVFKDAGQYVTAQCLVLTLILLSSVNIAPMQSALAGVVAISLAAITTLVLIDIFATKVSVAFVTRFPADPLRSVLFALVGFFQIALVFAIFYMLATKLLGDESFLDLENGKRILINAFDALYFSLLILTTIGFGDLQPVKDAYVIKSLIVLETLSGLFYVITIISTFVAWGSVASHADVPHKLSDFGGVRMKESSKVQRRNKQR